MCFNKPLIILKEVKYAVQYLSDKNLIQHGAGIHTFQNFNIQFQLQKRCFHIRKHLLLFIYFINNLY
ncbi:hypothetical protein FT637_09580 [Bacillus cereus]|nr:hypothetical protein [Bacillus cereus]